MDTELGSENALRSIYKQPGRGALDKQIAAIDAHCRRFIALSPFLCIGSARASGLADVSPRGGEPGFVHVLDDTTLAMPDRPGNNRLDTLTNLVAEPAVGLLFIVPGIDDCLRVNGLARISVEPDLMARFSVEGKPPRSVMLIEVREAYLHCTKALRRADLWNPDAHVARDALPSAGQIFKDHCALDDVPAQTIDEALETDARDNLY